MFDQCFWWICVGFNMKPKYLHATKWFGSIHFDVAHRCRISFCHDCLSNPINQGVSMFCHRFCRVQTPCLGYAFRTALIFANQSIFCIREFSSNLSCDTEIQQQGTITAKEVELERLKLDREKSMQYNLKWKQMYENLHEFCIKEILDTDRSARGNAT